MGVLVDLCRQAGVPVWAVKKRMAFTNNQIKNAELPGVVPLGAMRGFGNLVLAGAGPSLENTIPQLLAYQGPYTLACVDRAFPILTAAGLNPQIVFLLDYQQLTEQFFDGLDTTNALCICNTTCWPGSAARFPNRVWYRTDREIVCPMELELWGGIAKITDTPGLVGAEALAICSMMGYDSIALIGYDCSGSEVLTTLRDWIDAKQFPRVSVVGRTALRGYPRVTISEALKWVEKTA